jgi:hypothetical protein
MLINIDENFIDAVGTSDIGSDNLVDNLVDNNRASNKNNANTLSKKEALDQAQRNLLARKRIDELMDKKRLKELFDDSEDW